MGLTVAEIFNILKEEQNITLYIAVANAPVIWNPGPYGAADSGDIAGLKCRDLTSDESRQYRRCAGVLITR